MLVMPPSDSWVTRTPPVGHALEPTAIGRHRQTVVGNTIVLNGVEPTPLVEGSQQRDERCIHFAALVGAEEEPFFSAKGLSTKRISKMLL